MTSLEFVNGDGTGSLGSTARDTFRRSHVLRQDGQVTAVRTYRGEGQCFGWATSQPRSAPKAP